MTTATLGIEAAAPGRAARIQPATAPESLVTVVLAPTGRDAELIVGALHAGGMSALRVDGQNALIALVEAELEGREAPRLGALLVADDALGIEWSARLADVLDRQPSWSDLPIVLLAKSPSHEADRRWVGSAHAGPVAERFMARGTVTVVDRPVRVATLVSAARAALRARARQLEVRDLLEERTRAQREAEQANRAKSDFLAVMSHELRTPLNALMGYVNLLSEGCYGPLSPRQLEALARMSRAQRHLLGLINDVLNFARVEKGRVEYAIEPVLLPGIVAEIRPLIEPLLASKGLCYRVRVLPDVVVAVDREKLRQVLINLLSNAMKFTPPGGSIVVDEGCRADGTGPAGRVFLRISDTGSGIPEDKLATLFEPFVQVRTNPATTREGTGLGLAISRGLARGMGGDLRARSRLGHGSSFTIELPVASDEEGAAAPHGPKLA